jgi:hypothetical protein
VKLLLTTALMCATAFAGSARAASIDAPAVGTTVAASCHFGGGATRCRQQTVIVTASICGDIGWRLYSRDEIDSVREYRGNVVLPGLDGVQVAAGYGALLRPHARLVAKSAPHAFSETFPVADESCTA